MKQGITVTVLDVDDGDDVIKYRMVFSNDITTTFIDFYDYKDCFQNFAEKLIAFPTSVDDVVEFQIGSKDPQWKYFIFLKAFCYERDGRSVLHVKVDNKMKIPESNKFEFYIPATPASLNDLGDILNQWNPQSQKEIDWIAKIN